MGITSAEVQTWEWGQERFSRKLEVLWLRPKEGTTPGNDGRGFPLLDCSGIFMAYPYHPSSSNIIYSVDVSGELEAPQTCSLCFASTPAVPTPCL